jgi:cell division protease FtsH
MKPSQKTVALWLVLILLFASLFKVFDPGNRTRREIKFSEFITYVNEQKIAEVTFKTDNMIIGTLKDVGPDGRKFFETVGPTDSAPVFELLQKQGLTPNYERAEKTPVWQQVLISWFPMLLLFNYFLYFCEV